MAGEELNSDQKLLWLGFKEAAQSVSNVTTEIQKLKELTDFDSFESELETDMSSYTDFNNYLTNLGFTTNEADGFESKTKDNFNDFADFQNTIVNDVSTYEEMKTVYQSDTTIESDQVTEEENAASGIKFHESSGITKDNVSVPAGSIEIYGTEVHFSSSGDTVEPDITEETGEVTVTNITTSDDFPLIQEEVTIQATIENTTSTDKDLVTTLREDGTKLYTENKTVLANGTTFTNFTVRKETTSSHDYSINETGTVTVVWLNPPLQRRR